MLQIASVNGAVPALPHAMKVLLVASDPRWAAAVSDAASDLGIVGVSTCDARSALVRLSNSREHYSHLLVQPDSAEGLIEALVDVTSPPAGSETAVLFLGQGCGLPARIGIIPSASQGAIRTALCAPTSTIADSVALMPSELRKALAGTMIETRYQPIVSLTDGVPFAIEALARLNHPTRGTLSPDHFVPQIEDAGLSAQLTEIVSRQVFADMTGPFLRDLGLRVTVNFPLDVLLAPESLLRLEEQRLESGIAAERIIVELTESRPADDMPTLRASLDWLRSRGYKIAIDDVGPAVPRLTPLLDLPFTAIKLDMNMVRQIGHNAEVESFLFRSTETAHARGMSVVAEGVETPELWRAVKAMGVDAAQGFLVARPLPVAAVPVWLVGWNSGLPIF